MRSLSLPDLAPVAGFLVLLELAVGTKVVSGLLDYAQDVKRGYAGTTAAICSLLMGCDLLVLSGASDAGGTGFFQEHSVDAGHVASLAHWAVAFTALLALDALFAAAGTEVARRVVGAAAAVAGLVTILVAASALGSGGSNLALLGLLPAACLGGAALAGMLLGHWYLVVPAMSFRPLRVATYAVFGAVALQSAAIAVALLSASPDARSSVLAGDQAPLFWLLVIGSGTVFATAVNTLTLYFARIRANQPATAMLYVQIIAVVMGMVPAHLLFLLTNVPV